MNIRKKVGMTRSFPSRERSFDYGHQAGPVGHAVKTMKPTAEGGYEDKNTVNKPSKGHFDKAGVAYKKYLAEFRNTNGEAYEVGQTISAADFEEGKKLDVTGTSKGKGTQGNIKRHGHHRGPMTHGSKHKRLPGALAGSANPGRVFKGNAGPGRMGRDTVTVQNLELVKVIADRNLMLVKGAVPGARGGILRIRYAVKGQDAE